MSNELVEIPFGNKNAETATLLLAAAEELGLDPSVVKTSEGSFVVPAEVKAKAYPPAHPPHKAAHKKSESKEG